MEKKGAARVLYMDGVSIADICRMLSVSDTSVSKWVAEGEWKHKRTMQSLFDQTSIEALRELADYQLKALLHLKDKHLKAGEFQLIDKGEFDALSKAFANIKGPEMKWEFVVKITRLLIDFIEGRDPDLAKQLTEPAKDFVNEMRKYYDK